MTNHPMSPKGVPRCICPDANTRIGNCPYHGVMSPDPESGEDVG
jgi:hypothetical protein